MNENENEKDISLEANEVVEKGKKSFGRKV